MLIRMNAPYVQLFSVVVFVTIAVCIASVQEAPMPNQSVDKTIQLSKGVYVKIPERNNTEKLASFEIDTNVDKETGRGKQKKLLQRILPMFIMPFLIQSAIVPMFLSMLKFMLFKSMMVGKIALALIILNAFKNHNTSKGRESEMADVHYGYHGNGMEEYGAYVN